MNGGTPADGGEPTSWRGDCEGDPWLSRTIWLSGDDTSDVDARPVSQVTRIQQSYRGGQGVGALPRPLPIGPAPAAAVTWVAPLVAARATCVRLCALDVFRGLTVAGMLLVNNPGNSAAVYAPLRHAAWDGWTPTDLVFPFFLFIVGITTELSLASRAARGATDADLRRQVLRRGLCILLVGLALNWFPFYHSGPIDGVPHPGVLDRLVERVREMRLPGVLPRIALVYVATAWVAWRAPARRVAAVAAALLVGYWAAMTLVPVPGEGARGAALLGDPARTLQAWLDRAAFDWSARGLGNHLWDGTTTYDPEGLLSTLPAVATALLGVLAGRWVTSARPLAERLRGLTAAGAVGVAVGLAWGLVFPVNKHLWTSSYVLLTAGLAAVALAVATWLVDARGWRRGTEPLVVYGTNPLVAFAGSEVLAHFVHSTFKVRVGGQRMGLEQGVARGLEALGLDPRAASLGYALLFVLAWYGVLRTLYRRGVVVRL